MNLFQQNDKVFLACDIGNKTAVAISMCKRDPLLMCLTICKIIDEITVNVSRLRIFGFLAYLANKMFTRKFEPESFMVQS